jgi:ferric-dicitrate binding protein FerR (iron transport regulator)
MADDELTETDRRALDAWTPLGPPPGFAERVLAARERPAPRRRWPLVAGALACAAAAAVLFVVTRPASRAASGSLEATERTTAELGDRAVAVAEPTAALTWKIDDDGAAAIEQRTGDVFYRVDRGGPFVVHTPAGDVRVTGTCFRIEVQPMNKSKQLILSGTVGAALATAVVITVYEGHVIAETQTARTELAAGTRATVGADGRTATATTTPMADLIARLPVDDARVTREELLARATAQRAELEKLRVRLAELEQQGGHDAAEEAGRPWYDPSDERLKLWVAECHVRSDEPGFDRFSPLTSANTRGLEPGELAGYNAAMAEVHQPYKLLVRSLYIEATGDTAGADTLSIEAMRGEIQEKSVPGEHNLILQKIARERAGLQPPPADLSRTSPLERLFRAYIELGNQAEAALAKRLGPERAKELRGEGWGSRSNWSGCPDPGR